MFYYSGLQAHTSWVPLASGHTPDHPEWRNSGKENSHAFLKINLITKIIHVTFVLILRTL